MKKILTLAYLVRDNTICLAMKKRGIGEGETVWETVERYLVLAASEAGENT